MPTVTAVDGLAWVAVAVHRTQDAPGHAGELHGLVEAGVGLLPAGRLQGPRRCALEARGGDPFHSCASTSRTSPATVGKSAEQARELGYLKPADRIVMNRAEVLYVARSQVTAMAEAGYRPPLKARDIPAAGRTAIATLKAHLANLVAGAQISEHDFLVASKIAYVLCGGDVEAGSLVDEQWFLDLERECFMELIATAKTQARIEHTLKTGKPLRN